MYAIKKVVVDQGILRHTAQQFVDQLTGTKTHSMAADFMRLKQNQKKDSFSVREQLGLTQDKSTTSLVAVIINKEKRYFTSSKKLKMKLKNG